MTTVWRLNIKTAARDGVDPRRFCLDRNLLGVGWAVSQQEELDWNSYFTEASKRYKSHGRSFSSAINAIGRRMKVGDLCWTRDRDGAYYLGIISSDWRYDYSPDNIAADVVNVRACKWFRAGTVDVVPGKVVNSYIAGSTVQKVNGKNVQSYSEYLMNQLSGEQVYRATAPDKRFIGLLGSDDVEDVVALYMQKELGYFLVPSSCKSDTAAYEYVMIHAETGNIAVAQVKHGNVNLSRDNYQGLNELVVLCTTKGKYTGQPSANTLCLDADEVAQFALNNYKIMPRRIKAWMDLHRDCSAQFAACEEIQSASVENA